MPKLGSKAPAFSLKNEKEETKTLADFAGKWLVLYFYPKDDTPGCTVEACEFTDQIPKFGKLDAVVVGVSPDSPKSHQKFIKKKDLKISLLADEDHAICEKYGVWQEKSMYGKKFMGVVRTTFLIDPDGKIAHIFEKVKAEGHAEEVRLKLIELQKA